MKIETLSIDLETRSGADISKTGVYRYAEDPDFDILLFGVSVNGEPVKVYDVAGGEAIPDEILAALTDPSVSKHAFNASFERICLSFWLRKNRPDLLKEGFLSPAGWKCSMVLAAYNGLPLSLAQVGDVLRLEEQKMSEGKALIRYFCTPSSSQAADHFLFSNIEGKRFHTPSDDPEKWETFKNYNRRDVEVEMTIQEKLKKYPVPEMFRVPVEKHGINGHLRQKGKIAELALGYGGSVGALKSMGALDMGLQEDELKPLVDMWREANPNIVDYWWRIDEAAKDAIRYHMPQQIGSVRFDCRGGLMIIRLPSGRRLSYVKPCICENQYGGEGIAYYGTGATKKYEKLETYGPKLVENIVQAVSRDILADAMKRLQNFRIVGHVHDELIIEAEKDAGVLDICEQMGRTPAWIPGLMLKAEGYECGYYRK